MGTDQADGHGKVALITGAGGRGGIGRAIAAALARDGYTLALTDVERDPDTLPPDEVAAGWRGIESVAQEARARGAVAHTFWCDLLDPLAITTLVDDVARTLGRIDALINNARALMGRDSAPVTELDPAVWQSFLAVNATAPFLLMQAVGRHMIARGEGGRIVSIGSDLSKRGLPNSAAYAASKFALLGLTQSAALDLVGHGITVNAVCPGPVRTNRFNYAEKARADAAGGALAAVRERGWDEEAKDIPMGRTARPEEIADLVAFLVSERAGYITGQAYNVNGGMFFH
jgi:3-oxoacyl-[acyl-carrier protein] reductase/meso-butanediol dehydrogenase/(S,S)-butanediol dehydrogenase/diacetyl reductase